MSGAVPRRSAAHAGRPALPRRHALQPRHPGRTPQQREAAAVQALAAARLQAGAQRGQREVASCQLRYRLAAGHRRPGGTHYLLHLCGRQPVLPRARLRQHLRRRPRGGGAQRAAGHGPLALLLLLLLLLLLWWLVLLLLRWLLLLLLAVCIAGLRRRASGGGSNRRWRRCRSGHGWRALLRARGLCRRPDALLSRLHAV